MTQDPCLTLPHHFTHLGVCYPGSSATIQISSPDHPQPVTFKVTSVPEPGAAPLFAVALILGALSLRIGPRGGRKALSSGRAAIRHRPLLRDGPIT
jgi:hypothetical protein